MGGMEQGVPAGAAPRRVMVIFAHPDDAEFTCGGTLAKWANADAAICYVVGTDGSKGGDDLDVDDAALRDLRESEQWAAAAALGVAEVIFLRHPDGELASARELREELTRAIRRWRPDRLLTWDAWRPYQLHPDHKAMGLAATEAVLAAANPRMYVAQLANGIGPHRVPEVYLFGSEKPDVWVDIADSFAQKIAAIACHRSQGGAASDVIDRVAQCAAGHLGRSGYALAEAFKVLRPFCGL